MSDSLDPHSSPSADDMALTEPSVPPTTKVSRTAKSKISAKPKIILPQTASAISPNHKPSDELGQKNNHDTATKFPKLLGKLGKKSGVSDTDRSSDTPDKPTQKTERRPSRPPATAKNEESIADWMEKEYRGVSIYAVVMGILLTLILWTGISTVRQIQAYHQQYTELQKTKKDYRKLQIERQRLLIEQQTFSATPQIARRAVTELNMFYPKLSDRLIIQMPAAASPLQNHPTSDEATP